MIQSSNAIATSERTWSRVETYVKRKDRELDRVLKRRIPIAMLIGALITGLGLFNQAHWLILFGSGMLLSGLGRIALELHRKKRIEHAGNSREGVLAIARKELEQRHLGALLGLVLALGLAVTWLLASMHSAPSWLSNLGVSAAGPLNYFVAAALFLWAGYIAVVLLPRVRRERAELAD